MAWVVLKYFHVCALPPEMLIYCYRIWPRYQDFLKPYLGNSSLQFVNHCYSGFFLIGMVVRWSRQVTEIQLEGLASIIQCDECLNR